MRKSILLTLVFYLICVTGCHKQPELSGTWVMQRPGQVGKVATAAMLPKWTLTLYEDGTFTEYMEIHMMATAVQYSSGRYTRRGDVLTLNGSSRSYDAYGYRKEVSTRPLTRKLKYVDDTLVVSDNPSRDLVLRRLDSHAPSKPWPQPRPSDPRAVQIVHDIQRRYATLNTYSDEGTLTTSGAGFMVEKARFQTRFVRPHKFRFQEAAFADGKEWNKNVVWSNGKMSWWYKDERGRLGGSGEETGLADALTSLSPTSGYQTTLVPALLLPDAFGEPIDAFYKEITLAREEKISGKDCYVIRLNNPEGRLMWGMDLKLWVDKSSYRILRTYDRMPKATISYQPKRDIKVAESEFRLSPPK